MADASTASAPPAAPAAKRKGKLVMLLGVTFLLLAGGGAAAWWWTSKAAPKPAVVAAPLPPLYLALDPPFVVNFEAEQKVRFLQITAQLMTRDPARRSSAQGHDPIIRNDLLLLFSNQKASELSTRDGKEKLRAAALASRAQGDWRRRWQAGTRSKRCTSPPS